MAIQTLPMLRTEVKFRFIEYLKTSKAPYYEPELTVCPHCGQHASIISDFMWSCSHCNRNGDVVDYAMTCHGFRTEAEAIKHVCRVLGIKICFLDTVSADDLMDMQFPDNPELIEKMLGKGLYLLAGASKIGKSWLVLWMAHCISLGMPVWEFKTRKSGVLYLSLEDTHQRIQRRLVEVSGGETGMLEISTDAELLGSGLEEQLNNYLHDHPDTKLIIIDTLQKIRNMKADGYSYAGDYATLTALKQIADRFDMTMTECAGTYVEPEPTVPPTEPDKEPEEETSPAAIVAVLLLIGLLGAMAFFFLKGKIPNTQTKGDTNLDDYDYGIEDDEEYADFEEYEEEEEK